jgi:hypothetical protein
MNLDKLGDIAVTLFICWLCVMYVRWWAADSKARQRHEELLQAIRNLCKE